MSIILTAEELADLQGDVPRCETAYQAAAGKADQCRLRLDRLRGELQALSPQVPGYESAREAHGWAEVDLHAANEQERSARITLSLARELNVALSAYRVRRPWTFPKEPTT